MRRRHAIALLLLSVAMTCSRAGAQQRATPAAVGFLGEGTAAVNVEAIRAFRQGLSAQGFADDASVAISFRWAEEQPERLAGLAADLVRRRPDVIVTAGPATTLAAKSATSTIPIVFTAVGDPIRFGLVASLNVSLR